MKSLMEKSRVFAQEGIETSYFILPEENIKKCIFLGGEIGIKKGDLLYPNKWTCHEHTLIEQDQFDFEDYELIFSPEKWAAIDVQKALEGYISMQIDKEFKSLLLLNELPQECESPLKQALSEYAYGSKDVCRVEAFLYGDNQSIILDSQATEHDITYEYTNEFNNKIVTDRYTNPRNNNALFKLADKEQNSMAFRNEGTWYVSSRDETRSFTILKEIYDIEDMIQFTPFVKEEV
ncbi:hypothetical protein [Cytobacillus oceanisediminis]|uniref:hypothetical protein n=1 Tax=Cytobacillus oceanisediminis TaxID=665099 RepID=UPI001FB4FCB4|nr:hypothetical protein [Cytobacillus oceanisediminis]UOE58035.1 hypothetical protein IRB79_27615 [Cytobacillus oceanisediminis]